MGQTKQLFTDMREKSLYDINASQRELMYQIELMDGELTPEMEEELLITESQLKQKSIAYLEVIKAKEGFNGNIDTEIKRLQALKKRNNNIVTRLKDNLLNAVKTFGVYEIGMQKFGTRRSESVEIDTDANINLFPEEFKTVKITESANKTALKKALKSGIEIEGVTLKVNENLKIN